MQQHTCKAALHSLPDLLGFVRSQLARTRLTPAESRKVEVSLEEALVNVIRYAYPAQAIGEIELACQLEPGKKIIFIIKDQGKPFNPLQHHAKVHLLASLEEREEGGLGIFIMRQYMDEVSYERHGSYNILTLIKKLIA